MTKTEILAAIADAEAMLASGLNNATSDGESVSIDPEDLRRRIEELRGLLNSRGPKRRVRTFDLRNAF